MKKYRFEVLLFAFYTLLAVVITYPLVFKFNSTVYSIPERLIDGLASIYDLWWYKQTFLHGGSPDFIPNLGIDGIALNRPLPFFMPIANSMFKGLTILVNEVFAFNFLILLSFPLAGIAMYLLAYYCVGEASTRRVQQLQGAPSEVEGGRHYVTKNKWAAALAGFIFAFAPLHRRYAFEWVGMAQWHWLPLYVLALLKLDKLKSIKWGFLTGLLFSITFIENYYFGYFTIFFTLAFVCFRVAQDWLTKREFYFDRRRFKSYLLAFSVVLILTIPITSTFVKESSRLAGGEATIPGFTHEEWARFAFSARPWFYLLPNILHPVFGQAVQKIYDWIATKPPYFITKPFHPREHTLFLGWSVLLLSGFAVFQNLFRRKELEIRNLKLEIYVRLFLFLGIVMMIFSAPPYVTISGLKIYFPSHFLSKLFPMFRSYARFGVLVLLCFSILAAFGLKLLLEKIKNKKLLFIVYCSLFIFIFFEFLDFPRFRNENIAPTPAHEWIAQQPGDFAVAEYLVFNNRPLIRQRYHGKRLINPLRWAPEEVEAAMKKVDSLETAKKLSEWGVRYLLLHTRTPEHFESLPWYKLVASFPKNIFYVFEVVPDEKIPL